MLIVVEFKDIAYKMTVLPHMMTSHSRYKSAHVQEELSVHYTPI